MLGRSALALAFAAALVAPIVVVPRVGLFDRPFDDHLVVGSLLVIVYWIIVLLILELVLRGRR